MKKVARPLILTELALIALMVMNLFVEPQKLSFTSTDPNQEHFLRAGAYSVTVKYDVSNDTDLLPDGVAAFVDIKSKKYRSLLKAGTLGLAVGENQKSSIIWALCDVDDMQIIGGSDNVDIKGIEIEECVVFRYTMLVLLACLPVSMHMLRKYYNDVFVRYDIRHRLIIFGMMATWYLSGMQAIDDITYVGHDIEYHMARIASIADGIGRGQFPVYVYSGMLRGHGYVSPLFYNDAFLYLPAVLHLLKLPLGICYNIYIFFVNGLTVLCSFYCFKKLTGEDKYALMGTILYSMSIYRLTNIYTRAAVGEYTAMAFFPIVFVGIYNIYLSEKHSVKDCLLVMMGLTGIIKSHVISTEIVGGVIIVFCLLQIRKTLQYRRFLSLCGIVIGVLVLNADFLVPFLDSAGMELKVFDGINSIQRKGAYLSHILNFTSQGYGTDGFGMSLSPGGGILVGFVAVLLGIVLLNNIDKEIKLFWAAGVIAMAVSTRYFPWDLSWKCWKFGDVITKVLGTVQFPWRYLSVAVMFGTAATVLLYKAIEKRVPKPYGIGLIAVTIGASLLSVWDFYGRSIDEMETKTFLSKADVIMTYVGSGEYLPVGTEETGLRNTNVYSGGVNIISYKFNDGKYILECENKSDNDMTVLLPILNYEHYVAYDYGTGNEFEIFNGDNNNILILLPAYYRGTIVTEYRVPALWRMAGVVSLLAWLAVIAVYIGSKRGWLKTLKEK